MKDKQHITAFYLETLLLIVVFISIILVLTQIFGLGKAKSGEAMLLTNAVTLAQNGAEAFSAAEDPAQMAALLNEQDNAEVLQNAEGVSARYNADMTPDAEGPFEWKAFWTESAGDAGSFIRCRIVLTYQDSEQPVYELETAQFRQGVSG